MGQIAEDMEDGSCCEICGQYFEHPKGGIYVHEHYTTCLECWDELSKAEKKDRIKAEVKTF